MRTFLLRILLVFNSLLFGQTWQWVVPVKGWSLVSDVTVLNYNMYAVGRTLADSINFAGSTVKIKPYESFLINVNTNGKVVWAKNLHGGLVSQVAHNNSQIIIGGVYTASLQLDNFSVSAAQNGTDIFLACIDTLGNTVWLKSLGLDCGDHLYDMCTDNNKNIYMTGWMERYCGNFVNVRSKIFLKKFNVLGIETAHRELDSSINKPLVHCGTDGSLYLTGTYIDSVNFVDASNSYHFYGNRSGFLVKMDNNFMIAYVKIFKSPSSWIPPTRAVTDASQNCYVEIATDAYGFSFNNVNYNANTLFKFAPNGNLSLTRNDGQFLNTYAYAHEIRLTKDNCIAQQIPTNKYSLELSKLNVNLNTIYSTNINYTHDFGDHFVTYDTDFAGNWLMGGHSWDSLSFEGSTFKITMPSNMVAQSYFAKFGYANTVGVEEILTSGNLRIFPVPADNTLHLQNNVETIKKINLYDIFGREIQKYILDDKDTAEINVSEFPPGIYIIEVITSKTSHIQKILIE